MNSPFTTIYNTVDLIEDSDDCQILIKLLQARQLALKQAEEKKLVAAQKAVVKAVCVAAETTVKDQLVDARLDVKSGARIDAEVFLSYKNISVLVGTVRIPVPKKKGQKKIAQKKSKNAAPIVVDVAAQQQRIESVIEHNNRRLQETEQHIQARIQRPVQSTSSVVEEIIREEQRVQELELAQQESSGDELVRNLQQDDCEQPQTLVEEIQSTIADSPVVAESAPASTPQGLYRPPVIRLPFDNDDVHCYLESFIEGLTERGLTFPEYAPGEEQDFIDTMTSIQETLSEDSEAAEQEIDAIIDVLAQNGAQQKVLKRFRKRITPASEYDC